MKWAIRIGVTWIALVVLAGGAGLLLLRTDWFKEQLRRRVVAEVEKATGGRVQITRVRFNARRWQGRIEGLTIHGREGPQEKPLFHAGALELDLKVVSFLRQQVDLAGLRLEAVEVRLRVAQDGSTNLPAPSNRPAGRLFTEDLLSLAVGRFELKQGSLWWNDQRYSLETAISNLRAQVRFEKPGRYAGRLEAGPTLLSSPPRLPNIEHLAASFALLRDRIEISELAVRTAHSEGKVGGVVTDFAQPRAQFHYEAVVDAREAAALVDRRELKAGRFELRGLFESAREEWSTAGKVAAQQLAAAGTGFRLKNVSLAGDYHADAREVRAENLAVRLLGGEWKGRLAAGPSRVSLAGGLEGMRLEAAAEAFSTPDYPLAGLGWTAVISGPLKAEGPWSNLSVDATLALEPPENPGTLTPVRGVCRVLYRALPGGRAGEIQLQEARLATAATQVAASGRVIPSRERQGAVRQDFQFRVQTTRLEELTRVATVFGKKIEVPVRLDGRAILQGRLAGTLEAPDVDATVDVARFVHENRPWDSLTGRVQWSPRRLRLTGGRLTRGQTAISADLTAALENGELTDRSVVDAVVSVRDTQLEDLAALAGEKTPVSGLVTATLKLQGARKEPRGAGRLEIRRGSAWGERFDSLRTALVLETGEIRWNNLQLSKANTVVAGSGMVHPGRKVFRWNARADNLPLSSIDSLSKTGKKVTGIASFELAGSGRLGPSNVELAELALEGGLRLRKVAVDGAPIGDLSANIHPSGSKLAVRIESNFAGGQAQGTGEITPRDPFSLQGKLELRNLDLAALARMASMGDSPVRILADGMMVVQGEARRPESLAGSGELTRLAFEWSEGGAGGKGRTLRNAEPVKWRLANQNVTLDALHLVGEGTDLRGSGSAGLGPAGALNLAILGNLNLAALGGARPTWKVGGAAIIQAAVTGTVKQPDIRGSLEIRKASIGAEDLPLSLAEANGLVSFAGRRATIQKLTAKAGGGDITLSGSAEFAGGPVTYRLRADG
ncbi:MAG: hypothetical protein HY238_26575, partial [Acidobacteria bacterium]|nr:hypothetical protein [Acidobacteriota bacterium]